jgi:hypothetical protein
MDVRALREADHVYFAVRHQGSRHYGEIVATKQVPKRGPFDDVDKQYTIAKVRFRFDVYQEAWKGTDSVFTGFANTSLWNEEWATCAASLKVGDEPELVFTVDGGANQHVKDAGLHADSFNLRVRREGYKRPLSWRLETTVCPQNPARMVQREVKQYELTGGA